MDSCGCAPRSNANLPKEAAAVGASFLVHEDDRLVVRRLEELVILSIDFYRRLRSTAWPLDRVILLASLTQFGPRAALTLESTSLLSRDL